MILSAIAYMSAAGCAVDSVAGCKGAALTVAAESFRGCKDLAGGAGDLISLR